MQRWVVACLSSLLVCVVLAGECPSGGHCRDGQTCCLHPTNGYECCPFDQAECCGDHLHCCPAGMTCEEEKCVNASLTVSWAERTPTQKSGFCKSFRMIKSNIGEDTDNICPDQSRCPAQFSCLKATTKYGCCPLAQGIPCSDGNHCCPESHRCSEDGRSCIKRDNIIVESQTPETGLTESEKEDEYEEEEEDDEEDEGIERCNHRFVCHKKSTCCRTRRHHWSCCPLPNAVCCDATHCCPAHYKCSKKGPYCVPDEGLVIPWFIPWFSKLPALSVLQTESKLPAPSSLQPQEVESRYVRCEDGTSCPDGHTCCLLDSGKYGCCPLPNAVCCSDHIHCCPSGNKCDLVRQRCVDELHSTTTAMITKTAAMATSAPGIPVTEPAQAEPAQTEPAQTEPPQIESSPTAPDPIESDPIESDPTDPDQAELVQTEQKDFAGEVEEDTGMVRCDSKTKCPKGSTCCQLGTGWGCCPLRHAVCCSDATHCCPAHYKCSKKGRSCVRDDGLVIPWFSKLPALSVLQTESKLPAPSSLQTQEAESRYVRCEDGTSCPDGHTCCLLDSGMYGCCPLPNAVCCSDHIHCCPSGNKCDLVRQRCVDELHSTTTAMITKTAAMATSAPGIPVTEPAQAEPAQTEPAQTEPAQIEPAQIEAAQAKSSPTAPDPIESDSIESDPTDPDQAELVQTEQKDFAGEVEEDTGMVRCDSKTKCPKGSTCCQLGTGWGCCPLRHAVCCSDATHCCPAHYKCSKKGPYCVRDDGLVIPWFSKLPALSVLQTESKLPALSSLQPQEAESRYVRCEDGTSCPDGHTCCLLDSGKYGCCPLPNAVCCSDHIHCCPSGNKCDLVRQRCVDELHSTTTAMITKTAAMATSVPGIPVTEPAQAEPAQTEPAQTEPAQAEPAQTEPAQTETVQAEPDQTEPAQIEAVQAEPDQTEPAQIEPAQTEPAQTEPAQIEPAQTEPAQIEPAQTEPAQIEAVQAEPDQAEPAQAESSPTAPDPMESDPTDPDQTELVQTEQTGFAGDGLVIPWFSKLPALSSLQPQEAESRYVRCEDGTSCPDGHTCCLLDSGKYGCCPLPNAVCCSDKEHCCPTGFTCDVATGSCFRSTSLEVDLVPLVPLTPPRSEAEELGFIMCGGTACPDGFTCCQPLFFCCPYPNGVCCSNYNCCRFGQVCNRFGGCSFERVLSWESWLFLRRDEKKSLK